MDDEESHKFWILEETRLVISRKKRKSYSFTINDTCVLCFVVWFLFMMMLLKVYQVVLTKQENLLTQFLETKQDMDRVYILDKKLSLQISYVKSLLKNRTTYDSGN